MRRNTATYGYSVSAAKVPSTRKSSARVVTVPSFIAELRPRNRLRRLKRLLLDLLIGDNAHKYIQK